jgi:hypothetical protein
MAHLLLIASLVGASGVSGLASAGDLELMQMSVAMEKKPWVCQLKSDATVEEVESVTQEFENGKHAGSYVSGVLTDDGLNEVRAKYPVLVVLCEEDPVVLKATEHPVSVDVSVGEGRRTYPWGITSINADVVRGRGVGVNVYVMDSGIRISHSEFGGRAFAGVDMITSGSLQVCAPSDTSCAPDGHGHGTHCAGTVGASTYGVADGATLWAVKVINDNLLGNMFDSLVAEEEIRDNPLGPGPAVFSISLGGPTSMWSALTQNSHNLLTAAGMTVVVAAGNDNTDACSYSPAFVPVDITVASYAEGWAKSGFSNYGSCIDVWAPGSNILSLGIASDTDVAHSQGTSMACPHVSGLAAIMYEANPTAADPNVMDASQRWNLMTAQSHTGYITGIPPTPATVNLVALAPTPTPIPATPSPTPVPAPPGPPGASAVGDPHLQNIHGDRFDLMKVGKHVLINIPRGMSAENALIRVQADARRLGGHCADMYFQEVNVTGSWAEAKQSGGYHYSVSQREIKTPEWVALGKIELKVVHGDNGGDLRYLNVYVKRLGRAGLPVGGLLGEDDHEDVSIPPEACAKHLSLADDVVDDRTFPSASSVAVASLE